MSHWIELFSTVQFQHPWVFALFILLIPALIYCARRRDPSLRIPSLSLLPRTPRGFSISRIIPVALYALAGTLLIIGLAGPRFTDGEIRQKFQGVDIMLAVDLSASMGYYDLPQNLRTNDAIYSAWRSKKLKPRLDYCKEAIKAFIKARPNDRFGLIAFADQAYAICPPTLDHTWLNAHINDLALHTVGEGTGIAAPIASAISRTRNSEAKRKILVLFTDGANTVQNQLTPMQAAQLADSEYHMTIYTVGIGSDRCVAETYSPFGGSGLVQAEHEFDAALLNDISATTGGQYYAAADEKAMKQALEKIDKLEKKSEEMPRIVLYNDVTYHFAALSLLVILVSFSLSQTLFLRYP